MGLNVADQRRQRHFAMCGDFPQFAPELIFEANTGPATSNAKCFRPMISLPSLREDAPREDAPNIRGLYHFMKSVRLRLGKTLNPIWEITGDDSSTRR
jgi:hypothetical protein